MSCNLQVVALRRTEPPIGFADGSRAIALCSLIAGPLQVSGVRIVEFSDGAHRLRFATQGRIGRVHIAEPQEQELIATILESLAARRQRNRVRRRNNRETSPVRRPIPLMEQ